MICAIMWGLFVYWYVCVVISPNCFHNVKDSVIEEEQIPNKSKLHVIYLNKKTFPKLRTVSIVTIILFCMNILFTIAYILFSCFSIDSFIVYFVTIVYSLLYVLIGTFPIIKLNKRK